MNTQAPKFVGGDQDLFRKFKIRRDQVVGRGNSYVYAVVDEEGNTECVKEIRLDDNMSPAIFIKEVELLNKLKANPHPNIVEFRGSYCLQDRTHLKARKGYIQMEKGITNLKEYLAHRKERGIFFSEDDVLSFICSMLDAFTHLQKVELAHRDVKPSNILVFSEDPLFFKVCDVGAGTAVGSCDTTQNRTVIGTPYYLSPELFQAYRQKNHLTNYKAFKSDSYSLGLVFLEFCTLERMEERLVGEKEAIESTIGAIKKRYPNIVGIGKVLRRMLDQSVKTRMDFLELEQFISENDLLRNKIDSEVKLDPELIHKLASSQQVLIDKFEDLALLNKIASSGNSAPSLLINLSTPTGTIKKAQLEEMEALRNIRHISIVDLELDLEMCGLSEKEGEIIAYAIAKNPKLRTLKLKLWNNAIKNAGLEVIMAAVQTVLPQLEELQLSIPNNSIKFGPESETLFDFSPALNMHTLDLNFGFNEFHSDIFPRWLRGVGAAPILTRLALSLEKNKVNHVSFSKGVKELQRLSGLQNFHLNVSDNMVRDEGMFSISDLLAACPALENLSLIARNAEFADKGLNEIIKALSSCPLLEHLKINMLGNNFSEKIVSPTTLDSLKPLQRLTSVDLNFSNNRLGDLGLKSITGAFMVLANIKKLRLLLDGCSATEKGCIYVGRLLSNLHSLSDLELSLRYNQIELKGVQYICQGLLATKKIKRLKLVLEGTRIGNNAANYLSSYLLKLRGLSFVDLNMENCELGEDAIANIAKLVKEYSKKTEEITVNMRRNREMRMELYEQIKKDIEGSRVAIRLDNPSTVLEYSQLST